jgi:hypothetical protein
MAKMICGNCGLLGEPTKHRQGGKALALGLVVSPFFLAGVKWYMGCPACGAPNMISIDSPRGQELLPTARANAERLAARKVTLQPTDQLYYSEGWWIRPLNGPLLGPFSTREEAEFAERT